MQPIGKASFDLHAELAEKLDGANKYGYRRVHTYSALFSETKKRKVGSHSGLAWCSPSTVGSVEALADENDSAQVHPGQYTHTVLEAAKKTGVVEVRIGQGVSALVYDDSQKRVTGVQLENQKVVDADAVVVCMGPWSGQLPLKKRLPISAARAHSIVYQLADPGSIPAEAIFTEMRTRHGTSHPEVYPRPVCSRHERSSAR